METTIKWNDSTKILPKESGRFWCVVQEVNDLGISTYQWNCSFDYRTKSWSDEKTNVTVIFWTEFPKYPTPTNEIVNAIRIATNDFNTNYARATLLSWTQTYDLKGRPLNCDPNTRTGKVRIMNEYYIIQRRNWNVKIWKEKDFYVKSTNDNRDDRIFAEVDITPNYVREHLITKLEKATGHDTITCVRAFAECYGDYNKTLKRLKEEEKETN